MGRSPRRHRQGAVMNRHAESWERSWQYLATVRGTRADKAEAQRDALLAALKEVLEAFESIAPIDGATDLIIGDARAAIAMVQS
jgi:hypothetical protein